MRSNTNEFKSYMPMDIVIGEQENATYKSQEIPEYQNNPLIEALPKILSVEEVTESLAHFPPYSEDQRNLPSEIRIHLLENAREFFLPQSRHIELHYSISNMLRRGLINRNPLKWGYWSEIDNKLNTLKNDFNKEFKARKFISKSKARGFAIIGGGGTGKTAAIENDLSLIPQVIIHNQYQGKDLILKQLVWLKMDCPQDGSIKGLCREFFQTVDEILETDYYYQYGKKGITVDEMLLSMARVAAIHCLGVIGIDEIQDLRFAKSDGANRLLNFFVHLENRIGVPYVFTGTPAVEKIFTGEFRQARRASEQGDFYWDRIPQNSLEDEKNPHKDWDDFIRTLFTYQYTKSIITLPNNILEEPVVKALYHYSQGIPAILLTLFVLAQKRAILSGKEQLTVNIVRSVEKDRLNLIRKAMDSIRAGNEIEKDTLSDIDPTKYLAALRARKYLNISENNPDYKFGTLSTSLAQNDKLNDHNQTDLVSNSELTIPQATGNQENNSDDSSREKQNKRSKKQIGKEKHKKELNMRNHIESAVEFL